ncbi:MAG: carboxypeptidase regulatory-like domain-containing protein [Pseudomonadales bacterium]|nr:carboxypeptidase regulatory-like domain-containing protein [Pseudomonadales bacterium]
MKSRTNFGGFLSEPLKVVVAIFMTTLLATASYANETSSAIRGVVTDGGGAGIEGATVTVVSDSTALTRTVQTNDEGSFYVRNLPISGTYTVTANSGGFSAKSFSEVSLVLGETTDLIFDLSASVAIEELVVTGTRIKTQVAVGPSASFGLETLERAPAINRNISDVIRIDPRIYVDESRGDINAVQCGGKNSRFNSLTVDGVRMNDSFGLNSNGYPTERMPFSYDAINQVAVELAPFDAKYGGFTACNINAVTKSGSNEFFGGVFYDYTDDDLRADSLEGDDINTGSFDETRWGFNVGGPIIQDKLFFFAAYEKLEGANLFDRGPAGSGAVNEIEVTQAELDEIVDIARNLYLYDPGPIPQSLENEDEKILVKLDWYISDAHRLAFTYNYNDGNNFTQSDGDNDEFEFENHLYERGAELNSYIGTLYSDWSDNFSTEIRLSHLELDNRQISVGGTDFGEMRIELDDVDVYIGGDDSRQSNKLDYEIDSISFRGNYQWGDHLLSFGIERDELEVFNLFIQHTETEIRFEGIENFRNGFADAIYYNNAPSHNPNDAAADWGYEVTTAFIQDEFDLADNLTVVAGLRYDRWTTGDEPVVNPDFLADYGFGNNATLDGESLLQPRIGFTYFLSDAMTVRGGVGKYSGGDPNVWLSNNYSNNNVLQFGQRGRNFGYTDGSRSLFDADVVYRDIETSAPAGAGPGWGIPSELHDAVSGGTGSNFEINYLDPSFEIPSEWKFALGVTYEFENNMTVTADLLWTRGQDTAIVKRGDLEQVGTNADGYPQYDSVRESSFVLTNSDEGNESFGASIFLTQFYDNGMDWTVGYAYTDAEDVSPMTSSVAFSNYQNRAFFDPQEEVLSPSNYNVEHRFTGTFNWRAEWFGAENPTILSFFGQLQSGQAYSNTVPGNPIYRFRPFLEGENVLEPGSSRNSEDGEWWFKVDMRIEQQFRLGPGQAAAFLVVDNLTNLLNDDWGVLERANFPFTVGPGDTPESRIGDASRYEIRLGARYSF